MPGYPRAQPGSPRARATLGDVARMAGVSTSVASRALRGDPALRARPETRRRIRQAASALGYAPSHAARSLRLARAFAVGLIVRDLANPVREPLIRGVEDVASRLGYTVYIVDERARPGADVLRSLADEGRADGFLLLRDDGDIEDLGPLLTGAVPVVLIGARQRRSGSVVLDDAASSRLATAHLLELGHRDIAFIDARGRTPTTAAGERGFLETIRSAGMRRRSAWLLQGSDPAAGRSAIQRLCSVGGRRPTAVVVADLLAAMGALLGARDVGLAVPQQLSIVALGDAWLADHCWPPLTTVRLPFYELGEHAMHQLHESLAGGPDRDVLVSSPPPRLLCRASTGPPPRRVVRGRLRGLARQGMGEDLR